MTTHDTSLLTRMYQRTVRTLAGKGFGEMPAVRSLYRRFTDWSSLIPMPAARAHGLKIHQNLFMVLHGPDYRREFEPSTAALLKREVHAGNTVLDIGAHVGYYTSLLSTLVGPSGKVFAFEPGRYNLRMLRKTLRVNELSNVTVVPKAVSNSAGSADFFEHGAQSSIGHKQMSHLISHNSVDTIVLDDFLPHDLRVDFIKMDIEGSEMKALLGMKRILSGPVTLIFEYYPGILHKAGVDPGALLSYLATFGFTFYDAGGAEASRPVSIEDILRMHPSDNRKASNLTNILCKKS